MVDESEVKALVARLWEAWADEGDFYPVAREALRWRDETRPQPAEVAEGAIEAGYWEFDARRKGYGAWKELPQSERDAFKWAVRAMLAAAKGGKP